MSHQLSIRFAGICTHFRFGTVAGVPHRVVLPNAAMVTTGQLAIRRTDEPLLASLSYYLLPHYPQITIEGVEQLFIPTLVGDGGPAVQNGDILSGIRLQVLNARETEMTYETDQTPKLTDFDPQYMWSSEVVQQGRAACYFDFYGGAVQSVQAMGGAMQTIITVTTEDAPRILVTPLASSNAPTQSYVLQLPARPDTLWMIVKNLEPLIEALRDSDWGAFDFLLNYLTAHGGIPQVIRKLAPGMKTQPLSSMTPEAFAEAMHVLVELERHPGRRRQLLPTDEITPSCSDSQYP